eukprot:scaffold114472_cov35-Prasinocladus_malaysianus.AAC.1
MPCKSGTENSFRASPQGRCRCCYKGQSLAAHASLMLETRGQENAAGIYIHPYYKKIVTRTTIKSHNFTMLTYACCNTME